MQQANEQAHTEDEAPDPIIVATMVDEKRRSKFLPHWFTPRHFLRGEGAVYDWLSRLCPAYDGGYWEFFELSNGGFYMAPRSSATFRLSVDTNGYSGEVSADAAGIIATLFALNGLMWRVGPGPDVNLLVDRYEALIEFARQHCESEDINRAID